MDYCIVIPILLPMITGLLAFILPLKGKKLHLLVGSGLLLTLAAVVFVLMNRVAFDGVTFFDLMQGLPVYFRVDEVGILFSLMTVSVWILAGAYSFRYMSEEKVKGYYGFFMMTLGVLLGLDYAGNLVTMYLLFELVTLASFPMVLQTRTHEAVMAALKYALYSLCGAYMGLFSIYIFYRYSLTLAFTTGGTLNLAMVEGNRTLIMVAALFAILGFGVKAGMFPMHAWLPTAHPVAPAPASAVLSGVIVKAGVLAMIRVVYYIIGPDFLRGTWVQSVFMILSLITVFMGSLLAYREPVLKKRLAYSTVSQLSYILFGLAVLEPTAFTGSLLHVLFHAVIKTALFLCAGAFIHETGKERVDELTGIGKRMPVTTFCFTIVSLGLIGIPPTGGFISKWYLAVGSLSADIGAFAYIGPAILLVSALLTAGYLLPIPIKGFFPGADFDYSTCKKKEASPWMVVPIVILTVVTFVGGCFPTQMTDFIGSVAASVF